MDDSRRESRRKKRRGRSAGTAPWCKYVKSRSKDEAREEYLGAGRPLFTYQRTPEAASETTKGFNNPEPTAFTLSSYEASGVGVAFHTHAIDAST